MKPRIIFIHGNQTMHWNFAWTSWFKTELEKLGFETVFETMPDSIIARAKYWLPFLQDYLKAGENDVLVGWSSGATAALRYAENHQIRGSVLVAPSYTNLNDELEKQSGYFDLPWNWEAIRNNQEAVALFYSENDPYIPFAEFKYIASQINPQEFNLPNRGHFSDEQTFPELLNYIVKKYS